MKISILPKFDQFYEKSYTLKTPFPAAIVQFQFHCATAITGPAITGRNLRLNSGSTLPSFRVYKFQEKFENRSNFTDIDIFLNVFVISIQGSKKRLDLSPNPDFMFLMQIRGPLSTQSPVFVDPVHLQCTTGLAGYGKNSETQSPCLASTIICPIVGPSSVGLGQP